jgi:hypothetical protein
VCHTEKQNFLLFDMTTHPLHDSIIKTRLVKKVCCINVVSEFTFALGIVSDNFLCYLASRRCFKQVDQRPAQDGPKTSERDLLGPRQ